MPKINYKLGGSIMEYIYINGEIIAIDLDTANNEDINGLLDWIEEHV